MESRKLVEQTKFRFGMLAFKHSELLAKSQVLQQQTSAGAGDARE